MPWGGYTNETRWISRDDFNRLKDIDPYVKYVWSFGNKGTNYLYSKEIEPWKKALHYARVLKDNYLLQEMGIISNGSSIDIKNHKEEYKIKYMKWYLKTNNYPQKTIELLNNDLNFKIKQEKVYLQGYLIQALKKSGLKQREVGQKLGTYMSNHYFQKSQWTFPTKEEYDKMQTFLPLDKDYDEIIGLSRIYQSLESLQGLESLQRLNRLNRLNRLDRLDRLDRLQEQQNITFTTKNYWEIKIENNSLVYCDIPYKGTAGYNIQFDYEKFYNWCSRQKELVVISEYSMPNDKFICIAEESLNNLLSTKGATKGTERLYIPKHQQELYNKLMNKEIKYEQTSLLDLL